MYSVDLILEFLIRGLRYHLLQSLCESGDIYCGLWRTPFVAHP